MSRRDKLIDKMRHSPASIHFRQIDALLKYEGFVLFAGVIAPIIVPTDEC